MAEGTLLAFRVGSQSLAVDAIEVAEVVRRPQITRVPNAPDGLAGLASLRGEVAPVVAMDRVLGEISETDDRARLVVLRGAPPLGLAVDEILGLKTGEVGEGGLLLEAGAETRRISVESLIEQAFSGIARRPQTAIAPEPANSSARAEPQSAFLGFRLAGQPYALPLEQVREALTLPASLSSLPGSEDAMFGLIDHRGALLPVVRTRVLLGLPAAAPDRRSRIVLVAIGDARVGLLVDELKSVLRAGLSALGAVPKVLNRGAGEAQIDAMLRTSDGELVSILAPERLFREESVAQILEDARQKESTMTSAEAAEATQRVLIFTLGTETYGLPIEAVEEVVRLPARLTRLPKAPAFLKGVMNHRGSPMPVVDQRMRFAVEAQTTERQRVIVTQVGEAKVGFAVDAVLEILEVAESALSATPELAADAGRLFDKVVQVDGRMVLLVNPAELLGRAEADLVMSLAREAMSPA